MVNLKIKDPMCAKSISDLHAKNTLCFTPKQLLYFLDIRLKSRVPSSIYIFIRTYIVFNVFFTVICGLVFLSKLIISVLTSFLRINLPENIRLILPTLTFPVVVIFYLFKGTNSAKINYIPPQAMAKFLQILGVVVMIAAIITSIFIMESFILFVIRVITGIISIYLGTRQREKIKLVQTFLFPQSEFQQWLNKWQQINSSPPKILPSSRQEITPVTINPDMTAYSFDRLVVSYSSSVAQLLIANNFHFENNCAILSITGYPQSIFNTTVQMLRRNPHLKVYGLQSLVLKVLV
jgi:lysylphosphatidylglycerol synthetase-like protein (DUF2156 family)